MQHKRRNDTTRDLKSCLTLLLIIFAASTGSPQNIAVTPNNFSHEISYVAGAGIGAGVVNQWNEVVVVASDIHGNRIEGRMPMTTQFPRVPIAFLSHCLLPAVSGQSLVVLMT